MHKILRCPLLSVLALGLVIGLPPIARAQVPGALRPAAAQPPATRTPTSIPRESPRAAVRLFLDATRAGRWDDAARFLLLTDEERARGSQLARRLATVLESRYRFDPDQVSAAPEGRLDDDLPTDIEEIAQVEAEPVRMERTNGNRGVYWVFDRPTVAHIDDWYSSMRTQWLRSVIVSARVPVLLRSGPMGLRYWQWIVVPVLILISWLLALGVHALGKPLMASVTARTKSAWDDRIVTSFGPPFTLAFGIAAFTVGWILLELPRPALMAVVPYLRVGVAFAAVWALWRSSGVLFAWAMSRSWAASSASYRNLVSIGSKIWQGAVVSLGAVAILDALGFPVTTALAGIGIGGLAIAFGAQKTIENLFGSLALAVDQPFRIGDFVKVQDFVGTVEDIGLRSTRFRTLDRTVVSIPNGKLADERLESFEVRDRMRFATTVGLTYGTTRTQMEHVLGGFDRVLRGHPLIWPDSVTVKFLRFAESSLDIEIMAWFRVPTWGEFQRCREEVLLEFMGVVERAGASFAFPTRTVHMVSAVGPASAPPS
jgi:MscS family membrane protein